MNSDQTTVKTTSLKRGARRSIPKDAAATRIRLFEAAKIRFSHTSYEAVGVREIAGDVDVDAALVMRYFGSKEELFREIAVQAFESAEVLQGDPALLGERMLHQLFLPMNDQGWRTGYDPFRLLLCSISSEIAGPIISQAFHRAFVEKLAGSLQGPAKEARAALIASYVLGVALLRITEPKATFEGRCGQFIRRRLSKALDDCFSSGPLLPR